ncbi:cellulase N-terminal Ig-like domain-containing protein, partial [Streptomyces hygroscopicus]
MLGAAVTAALALGALTAPAAGAVGHPARHGAETAARHGAETAARHGAETAAPAADTGSPVRVNQVGYLTHGPKKGTVVTGATKPLTWRLRAADGTVRASGTTTPAGIDPSSRQHVHTFDFSEVTDAGAGYTITIGG